MKWFQKFEKEYAISFKKAIFWPLELYIVETYKEQK